MPRGDRTGPRGAGPGSGRGQGYCQGNDAPGFVDPAFGRGRGWRRNWGSGFGWRHCIFSSGRKGGYYPGVDALNKEEALQALKAEADWLERDLDAVRARIQELETKET
jgi:hypothetical protein